LKSYSVLVLFFFLFLIFSSGFSTPDGWIYAASIKYHTEFYHPHHLLYNAFGYVFCYLPAKAGADILACLKVMNSLFAVLALRAIQLIMIRLLKSESIAILISCLSGISFSFIRYATENETYIIPLTLGLFALYWYFRFMDSQKTVYIIFSAFLASLSVLFHLSYILWLVSLFAILLKMKRWKPVITWFTVSLIIPFLYAVVIFSQYGNLETDSIYNYLFGTFESVHFRINSTGLLFSAVNLVRSFIQVHGYMYNMINQNLLLVIPAFISLIFFILSIRFLPSGFKRLPKESHVIILIILLMGLLAILADGNAEFMVMIPVLSFILLPLLFHVSEKFLVRILAGMIMWNIAYGIIPLHINSHLPEDYLCEKSGEYNAMIIASDELLLKSMIYYKTGVTAENIFKSPALFRDNKDELRQLEMSIDSALGNRVNIYTDCIAKRSVSRASILEGDRNEFFFKGYNTRQVMKWETILGIKTVDQITGKTWGKLSTPT
jgi:hypothetical protein